MIFMLIIQTHTAITRASKIKIPNFFRLKKFGIEKMGNDYYMFSLINRVRSSGYSLVCAYRTISVLVMMPSNS